MSRAITPQSPRVRALREPFESVTPFTVGLEEEAMLLDSATLDLLPVADTVLSTLAGDDRFKRELPASQIELVTPPRAHVCDAIELLAEGRLDLAAAAAGIALPAVAGVHPFASTTGEVSRGDRYDATVSRYGPVARRQLVAALQVHVAVGGADRTLAVHDALRCFLPEVAALGANAPWQDGQSTGLASVRPLVSQQLPRQGAPPVLGDWESFAAELEWGERAGALNRPGVWWWELRPHLTHGTLEVRVPDAQTTIADAAAIAATVQALVVWLADRWDAGRPMPTAPDWRIAENRWSAMRWGVEGELADLATGELLPTRTRLERLLATVSPAADRVGCADMLDHARALIERNGSMRQRDVATAEGARALALWLVDGYEQQISDFARQEPVRAHG